MMNKVTVNHSSDEFIYIMIKYSDKKIFDQINKFEELGKTNKLSQSAKKAAYMSLYI